MSIALIVIAALCFILDRQFSRWQKGQPPLRWAKAGLVFLRICVWLAIISALLSALIELVISRKEARAEGAKAPIIVSSRPPVLMSDSEVILGKLRVMGHSPK